VLLKDTVVKSLTFLSPIKLAITCQAQVIVIDSTSELQIANMYNVHNIVHSNGYTCCVSVDDNHYTFLIKHQEDSWCFFGVNVVEYIVNTNFLVFIEWSGYDCIQILHVINVESLERQSYRIRFNVNVVVMNQHVMTVDFVGKYKLFSKSEQLVSKGDFNLPDVFSKECSPNYKPVVVVKDHIFFITYKCIAVYTFVNDEVLLVKQIDFDNNIHCYYVSDNSLLVMTTENYCLITIIPNTLSVEVTKLPVPLKNKQIIDACCVNDTNIAYAIANVYNSDTELIIASI